MPFLLALPSIYTHCKLADFKISLNCGIENFTITDFKVSLKCGIEIIINFVLLTRFSDDLSLSSLCKWEAAFDAKSTRFSDELSCGTIFFCEEDFKVPFSRQDALMSCLVKLLSSCRMGFLRCIPEPSFINTQEKRFQQRVNEVGI